MPIFKSKFYSDYSSKNAPNVDLRIKNGKTLDSQSQTTGYNTVLSYLWCIAHYEQNPLKDDRSLEDLVIFIKQTTHVGIRVLIRLEPNVGTDYCGKNRPKEMKDILPLVKLINVNVTVLHTVFSVEVLH